MRTFIPQDPEDVHDRAASHLRLLPPAPAQAATGHEGLDLEVIVPAFNEESRIGTTLEAIADQLETMDISSRVRVIDNGSADRTADVVDSVSASHDGAVDITVEGCSRPGKGRAVAKGILTSPAGRVGFCDADLATPASAIAEAVGHLDDGWPVVIGSRYLPSSRRLVEQPLHRRLGGTGFRWLTKALTADLEVADTQCGFKFFDHQAAQDIFSAVGCAGFAFDVEVLVQAKVLGYSVKEFPVEWTDREGSTFRALRDGPAVTRDLLRVRRSGRACRAGAP